MKNIFFACILFFSTLASANVNGTHLQNFNPTVNGLDFVTVQSSKTISKNHFSLGIYFDYATNSLPFFKAAGAPNNQKFSEPNDRLTTSHFSLGYGIFDNWDVGLNVPVVLSQDIDDSTQLGSFDDTGVTEFRLSSKYKVWNNDLMGVALIGSANFDRINNNPFAGSDPGPTLNFEAAFDYQFNPLLLLAFNLGYRFANTGGTIPNTGVSPLGDQLLYSAALSYQHLPWDTTLILELFGSDFTETKSHSLPTDRKLNNLELLAAARKMVLPKLSVVGGLSTETHHGFASPDLRIFVGAQWLVGPLNEPAALVPAPTPIVETVYEDVPTENIILSSIVFNTKKSTMTPASRASMDKPLAQLTANKESIRLIIVEGHADSVGSDSFNQTLSELRAKAVRSVLLSELTLAENQVQARGFGESKPIASNSTETGRQQNRRVELKIYRK